MSEWTTPGLERRPRKVEAVRLVSYGPCSDPLPHLQILAPPKVNNVKGAEPEWVTVDETHNWTTHA